MDATATLDALYRAHAARLIARLVRIGGRVDWAEAAVHDAFVRAVTQFRQEAPVNAEGWLYRVARNRLTDIARQEQVRRRFDDDATRPDDSFEPHDPAMVGEWDDELLQMIVASCHPALTPDEQVALSLRILCGLPQPSIALIFRAAPDTIKKRLTNAKSKLRRQASVGAPMPQRASERVPAAMRVLYMMFTEGHKPRSGEHSLRADLCAEAIRLTEVLLRAVPEHAPTLHALAALMKLGAARLPAREQEGAIVLLEDQDRSLWDGRLIDAGLRHLQCSAAGDTITPYHHEATIAACHCIAADFDSTDWHRIVKAYDALLAVQPSVMLEVNRAVAVGFGEGFERGLTLLGGLPTADVSSYLPFHAAVAALAERAGHREVAASGYRVALELSRAPVDRAFFEQRLARLGSH